MATKKGSRAIYNAFFEKFKRKSEIIKKEKKGGVREPYKLWR